MNLFKKASPWLAGSLLMTAAAFGQSNNCTPCKPKCPDDMKPLQLVAGYNAPSRVDVRGCWDLYAEGSFTYWQPLMSNTEIGYVSSTEGTKTEDQFVNQDFGYKPGFQVALGMNFDWDNWDSIVEYTWFRGSDTTTVSPEKGVFHVLDAGKEGNGIKSASQKWKLHMDILDWNLGRNYYVGTKLTFRPSLGARAAWIRQNLNRSVVAAETSTLNRRSNSWGVGPRAAIDTNWNLGEGFRIFGNGGADILFTQYTKLKARAVNSASTAVADQRNLNFLRAHMDLELGLGWGSYFDCNNWHVDLSAGYGFQVFFDQNMFREFNGGNYAPTLSNGNLFVHGLTATLRFDF